MTLFQCTPHVRTPRSQREIRGSGEGSGCSTSIIIADPAPVKSSFSEDAEKHLTKKQRMQQRQLEKQNNARQPETSFDFDGILTTVGVL